MLLIIFLQDIIKPPVLPKLFSDNKINEVYYKRIGFVYKIRNNKKEKDEKSFINFFNNIIEEDIPIPKCLFKKDNFLQKCKQFYKNNKQNFGCYKNTMTCSELFLKFLEFITYYCKFDTIYARCSIEKEGYFNMYDITDNDENEKEGNSFYYYFTKKYNKYMDYYSGKKIRNGLILIRDPVDPHYNPVQKMKYGKDFEEFINILKLSYSILIKYGSFEKLKEKIKSINEERNDFYKNK